jgi:hypothetical protein
MKGTRTQSSSLGARYTSFPHWRKKLDMFPFCISVLAGKYPHETVCTVARIARSAEAVFDHDGHFDHLMELVGS